MSLPYAIEYLLSLERENGGRLVGHGATQIFIPIFPANLQLVLQIEPTVGVYAHIGYIAGWSTSMVPDAFQQQVQIWGTRPINYILSADWVQREHADGFVVETQATPSYTIITNRTNLAQYYETTIAFITIATIEDYEACMRALHDSKIGTELLKDMLKLPGVS